VCIQLFRGNFDADVPFNIRQSRGKCFDDILSRAPRRDYANRKIKDIKKNRQRPVKLTEPQRRKSKAFFLSKARAPNLQGIPGIKAIRMRVPWWLPPSPGRGESSESKVAHGLSQHQKCAK